MGNTSVSHLAIEITRPLKPQPRAHRGIVAHVTHLDGSERQRGPDDIHHDLPQLLHNQSFTPLQTHTAIKSHNITTPSCPINWRFYFLIEISRVSEGPGAASHAVFAAADGDAVIFGFFIPMRVLPVRVIVDATTLEL